MNGKPRDKSNVTIQVVGKSMVHNELIASYLEDAMETRCIPAAAISRPLASDGRPSGNHILLLDCQGKADFNPWEEYHVEDAIGDGGGVVVLYNVNEDSSLGLAAIERGARGMFQSRESFKMFPKGLHAIIKGELWFSRTLLTEYLTTMNRAERIDASHPECLTLREKEILLKIAAGATNDEISGLYLISTNTVRSHIYNIYKKIRVKNRLQASLWTASHL